ncbi:MAG: malectin domain-containing carbohydrate-binding protein, partial [Planctomycetota bacterium]
VHAYDPVMDSWRQGPSLPENMSHFEPGTFVDSGMLYIAGGKDLTTGREVVATVLELDPVLGEWAYLPPLPAARYGPGAQLLGGRLYAANGAAPGNVPQTDLYSRDWNTSFPNPLYINCGGPEVMSATGSFCWCGDIGYQNGRVANFNPNSNIGGTDEDDVFDQQRESRFSNNDPVRYRLPLGPGIYRVKFHLAERGTSAPGNRVLDLEVEGEVLAAGVDLAADPGFQIAFEQGFDVRVLDDNVDIAIRTPPGQRALVGALEVEKLPDDHFEFECMNAANSTGAMAEMDFLGTSSIAANDFTLLTTSVPFSQFGLFVQGENPGSFGLPAGGTLCIGGPFFRLPIVQAVGNTMSYELDLQTFFQPGTEIVAGSTWRFQGWFRDPAGPTPSNLSNALKISFTP